MVNRYAHLLSPFQVGNVVFRNRIFTAPMGLHALQGGELYPTEAIITHYANKAKGGAAVVTCSGTGAYPVTPDKDHMAYDLYIGHSQHYLAQLADAIHFYGAKASMEIQAATKDPAYHVVGGVKKMGPGLKPGELTKEITPEIMEEVKENLKDQVRILKRIGYDMCMLAVENLPYCFVDDCEIRRDGVSYTVDTVVYFRRQYPNAELVLLVGSDMFLSFQRWHRYKEILRNAGLAVVSREGDDTEALEAHRKILLQYGKIFLCHAQAYTISSTKIREIRKKGGDFSCYLPEKVVQYIISHKLYLE